MAPNHFRLPLTKINLFHWIMAMLRAIEYEMDDRPVVIHLGWPMSSWFERLSIGVMIKISQVR
jgi:hypothetical protein